MKGPQFFHLTTGVNWKSELMRQEDLGLLSLRRGGLGHCMNAHKYLKGGYKEGRARLFSVVPNDWARGSGYTLAHRRCHLNIRKFFLCAGNRALAQDAREVVVFPSLNAFKTQMGMVLGNWLWVTLLEQGGLDQMATRGPC